MEITNYQSQDTRVWPGKITLVVTMGNGTYTTRNLEQELQKSFTTNAVLFQGNVEKQSDLPIVAKKMKLKNKLVRINTNGTNPQLIQTMMTRRVVDYVSLHIPAPLYKEAFEKVGAREFEKVRETIKLLESSTLPHEIVLEWSEKLTPSDIKDAASQIPGTFVLYADKGFDELRELAQGLTGPKNIHVRNNGGEQAIT